MLAEGTKIRLDSDGSTINVQRLQAGDRIFDQLANTTHKIIEIKSRAATFERHQTDLPNSILQPIKLKAGALDGVWPSEELVTSPAQQIFIDKTPKGSRAELSLEMACNLTACGKAELLDIPAMRYFAIFTKGDCAISANGALVRSYCSSLLGG